MLGEEGWEEVGDEPGELDGCGCIASGRTMGLRGEERKSQSPLLLLRRWS